MDDLGASIAAIKPLADAVVDAATALNAAVRAAAEQGLSVRLDLSEHPAGPDAEPVPTVRARISKRIV
jgi:benzoyl-CoA reductase/2-hydroxyglutaryl-CoA dehydratase subunit BcrC/BadD/HgdB